MHVRQGPADFAVPLSRWGIAEWDRGQAAAMGVPADPPAAHARALPAALEGRVQLRVLVVATFALDDVVAAAQVLENPHAPGKVVLVHSSLELESSR